MAASFPYGGRKCPQIRRILNYVYFLTEHKKAMVRQGLEQSAARGEPEWD